MDTERQPDVSDGIWRDDYAAHLPIEELNAQVYRVNQARIRVAAQLNISLDGGGRYNDFCAAWDEAIRRATLATGEVVTPYPEADVVKDIMDDAARMTALRLANDEANMVMPVTPMAVREVRRRSIVQELRRDYLPDVDPIAVERAMDEAEGRIEGWQTGDTPTLITVSLVVDIIREQAVPGSLAANLHHVRNVGRVLADETQDVPQEVGENRATALREILDRHPNVGAGTTMQFNGEGELTRFHPVISPPKELDELLSEALIDLVGATSEEDLAKNASLPPERIKEIMELVSHAIDMRRTNQ